MKRNQSVFKKNLEEIKSELNGECRRWNRHKNRRSQRIGRNYDFCDNVLKCGLIITIINSCELRAENYGKVRSYGNEKIELLCSSCIVCISGCGLCIKCYTEDELIISGIIKRIEYVKEYN